MPGGYWPRRVGTPTNAAPARCAPCTMALHGPSHRKMGMRRCHPLCQGGPWPRHIYCVATPLHRIVPARHLLACASEPRIRTIVGPRRGSSDTSQQNPLHCAGPSTKTVRWTIHAPNHSVVRHGRVPVPENDKGPAHVLGDARAANAVVSLPVHATVSCAEPDGPMISTDESRARRPAIQTAPEPPGLAAVRHLAGVCGPQATPTGPGPSARLPKVESGWRSHAGDRDDGSRARSRTGGACIRLRASPGRVTLGVRHLNRLFELRFRGTTA